MMPHTDLLATAVHALSVACVVRRPAYRRRNAVIALAQLHARYSALLEGRALA